MLDDKKKGIADIPEGFTEAELMDKMAANIKEQIP